MAFDGERIGVGCNHVLLFQNGDGLRRKVEIGLEENAIANIDDKNPAGCRAQPRQPASHQGPPVLLAQAATENASRREPPI
jgi:hypothetical protein